MYIDDFFRSLILLQSSYPLINKDFFQDKQYVQVLSHDQIDSHIQCDQEAQHYLIYTYNKQPHQLYGYSLDKLFDEIKQLSDVKIAIPASKAIYLEAAVLEAIYLYDQLIENQHGSFTDSLLPLSCLYNLFYKTIDKNQFVYPYIYTISCLQELFIARFYYFVIQYCYSRFQCQQYTALTHPYHFDVLVQNKLGQYLKSRPIHHISDLTYLNNTFLDQYIHMIQNDS